MSRKWILPVLIAAAAGVLAFAFTRYAACRAAGPELDFPQDISCLTRELKLTAAQAGEIEALHAGLGARLTDCCARHCAARARLGRALADETNGTAQADIVLADMCRAYEEGERATLEHLRRLRAVLNAEQRQRFDALMTECMCRPCAGHGDQEFRNGK
jgi:hypothetical protein